MAICQKTLYRKNKMASSQGILHPSEKTTTKQHKTNPGERKTPTTITILIVKYIWFLQKDVFYSFNYRLILHEINFR